MKRDFHGLFVSFLANLEIYDGIVLIVDRMKRSLYHFSPAPVLSLPRSLSLSRSYRHMAIRTFHHETLRTHNSVKFLQNSFSAFDTNNSQCYEK